MGETAIQPLPARTADFSISRLHFISPLFSREEILPRRESSKMKISRGRGREGELVQSQSDFHFATNSAWQKSFPACKTACTSPCQKFFLTHLESKAYLKFCTFSPHRNGSMTWTSAPLHTRYHSHNDLVHFCVTK